MPTSNVAFRSVCGRFVFVFLCFMAKRVMDRRKMFIRLLCPKSPGAGLILGMLFSYTFWSILLLRCGDVEVNPGPSGNPDRAEGTGRHVQTRLTTTKDSRRCSVGAPDPSLADVLAKLNTMDSTMASKLDEVREDVHVIKDKLGQLTTEVDALKTEVNSLRVENNCLRQRQLAMEKRLEEVERKNDDLENRSKRCNLIFHGLDRTPDETNAKCEERLQGLCKDKLGLGDIQFDRVHRISNKDNSPLIAKCTFFRDKVQILKAKQKLKGSTVFIAEDFSRGVREVRKKLSVMMKDRREKGELVKMVHDHLIIDGKRHFLSADGKGLVVERRG